MSKYIKAAAVILAMALLLSFRIRGTV